MSKTIVGGLAGTALAAAVVLGMSVVRTDVAAAVSSAPPAQGGSTIPQLTQEEWDANPETMRWQAMVYEIAGDDPDLIFDAGVFCSPERGVTAEHRATVGTTRELLPDSEPTLEPFPYPERSAPVGLHRLFDNFYWVGNNYIGIWIVTSDDGYIVYDSMNNAADARNVIVPAMEAAGLDPTQIRYLVFGHYHGDHTGGGRHLQRISGAQAIQHWADWDLYLRPYQQPGGRTGRGGVALTDPDDLEPMTRDIEATDGMEITIGNNEKVTASLHVMTGHTPGSLAMIVPVKYQGEEHPILLVTAGNHFTNINGYIGGYEHIWDVAIERRVESVMQPHPNTNMNLLARTAYVNDNYPPAINPLLYGAERTERYLNIVRACTRAWIAAVDML